MIDLFLHVLSEENPKLVRFAAGGLCNICLGNTNFNFDIYTNKQIHYTKVHQNKHVKLYQSQICLKRMFYKFLKSTIFL